MCRECSEEYYAVVQQGFLHTTIEIGNFWEHICQFWITSPNDNKFYKWSSCLQFHNFVSSLGSLIFSWRCLVLLIFCHNKDKLFNFIYGFNFIEYVLCRSFRESSYEISSELLVSNSISFTVSRERLFFTNIFNQINQDRTLLSSSQTLKLTLIILQPPKIICAMKHPSVHMKKITRVSYFKFKSLTMQAKFFH